MKSWVFSLWCQNWIHTVFTSDFRVSHKSDKIHNNSTTIIITHFTPLAWGQREDFEIFIAGLPEFKRFSQSLTEVPETSDLFFRFNIPEQYMSVSLQFSSGVFRGCSDVGSPRSLDCSRTWDHLRVQPGFRWFPQLNYMVKYFRRRIRSEKFIFLK